MATAGNLTTTPFRVTDQGVMYATKGYFGNGTDGIWIDGNGIVQFGNDVNIPTSTSQGYTIAVIGTSLLATDPVISGANTTYTVSGHIAYQLYNNGVIQTTSDSNCKVYLSGNVNNSINPI
jgi:hypothetical protein